MRNYFTFGEYDSRDFGVFIARDSVYNAPKRAYRQVQVPGRNGDLMIDEGRFENIDVTYPCLIYSKFDANIEGLRNALLSHKGYVRIMDSYHPDEFRLGCFSDDLSVVPRVLGDGGTFDVTFNCKPQRFLIDGETPIAIGEWGDTETANCDIVSLDLDAGKGFKSIIADIDLVQSFNGYDHPWGGGNGKNLIPYPYYETTRTANGLTFTDNGDGTITVNGTATATTVFQIKSKSSGNTLGLVPGETYIISGCPSGGSGSTYKFDILKYDSTAYGSDYGVGGTFTYSEETTDDVVGQIRIVVYRGTTMNNLVFKPMIRLASETDATWEPYANICPITGHTSATVTRTGKNLIPYPYYKNTETEAGVTWTDNGDGTITATGTPTATSYHNLWHRVNGKFPNIIAGQRYILSLEVQNGTCSVYFSHNVGATNKGEFAVRNVSNGYGEIEFTAWEDEYDSNALALYIGTSYGTQTNTIIKPMLRLASDADDTWEPYAGTTYKAYFQTAAGTVYGGTVDIVSGVLTVDKAFATLTGAASESWASVTQPDFIGFYLSNTETVLSGRKAGGDIAVNEFVRVNGIGWNTLTEPGQILYVSNVNIRVNNNVVGTTVEELRTWLAENPIEIAYELATPITYQLTPQAVSALVGINNIWADTGDVTVEYGDSPNIIINPTLFPAKPLIRVYGYGTLSVGDTILTIAQNSLAYIDIDSEIQDCYCGASNANSYVTFTRGDFPDLDAGVSGVEYSGNITSVEIIPRWFIL